VFPARSSAVETGGVRRAAKTSAALRALEGTVETRGRRTRCAEESPFRACSGLLKNDRNPPDLGLADARYEPSAVLPKPQGVALAAFPRPIGCAATLSQASVCSAVWGSPLRRVLVPRPTDAVEHWWERHRSTVLLPPTLHSADSERPARHG